MYNPKLEKKVLSRNFREFLVEPLNINILSDAKIILCTHIYDITNNMHMFVTSTVRRYSSQMGLILHNLFYGQQHCKWLFLYFFERKNTVFHYRQCNTMFWHFLLCKKISRSPASRHDSWPFHVAAVWGVNTLTNVKLYWFFFFIFSNFFFFNCPKAQYPGILSRARGQGTFCAIDICDEATRNSILLKTRDRGMTHRKYRIAR